MLVLFALFISVGTESIEEIVNEVPGFRFMGTKSPYMSLDSYSTKKLYLRNEGQNIEYEYFLQHVRNQAADREPWQKFCKPVHFSYVGRHGNRQPSTENMKKIERFVTNVNEQLTAHQVSLHANGGNHTVIKFFEQWKLHVGHEDERELNHLGHHEMYELGKGFARSFKLLFRGSDYHDEVERDSDKLNNFEHENMEEILIISSPKSRCVTSAKVFVKGLNFVLKMKSLLGAKVQISDILMSFHENCTKFIQLWDSDVRFKAEYNSYLKGREMQNIANKVGQKLGLAEYITSAGELLDRDNAGSTLWSVMNACAGETAHFGKVSPWCHLLDEEDFKHLSYLSDLKHFYKNTGYANAIGAKQSCELRNIFHFLDQTIAGIRLKRIYKKAVLRFGHSDTLIPLYSLLGLYKEPVPLTADYDKHVHRRFHLSRIVPYSANMALVLYECSEPDEPLPFTLDKYMLQLLVNEQPEVLPMCHTTLCSYAKVKNFYRDEVESCNFSKMCETISADVKSCDKEEL